MTLAEVFQAYGVTQAQLVARVGLKRQYAWMLWHGQRKLGTKVGKKIRDAFGIPLTPLLLPEEYTQDTLPKPTRGPA